MRPQTIGVVGLALLVLAGGACERRLYDIVILPTVDAGPPRPDGAWSTDAPILPDGAEPDDGAAPDAPAPLDSGPDACTNVTDDPANCGACGHVCSFENALPLCQMGVCAQGACLPGFSNLNNLP